MSQAGICVGAILNPSRLECLIWKRVADSGLPLRPHLTMHKLISSSGSCKDKASEIGQFGFHSFFPLESTLPHLKESCCFCCKTGNRTELRTCHLKAFYAVRSDVVSSISFPFVLSPVYSALLSLCFSTTFHLPVSLQSLPVVLPGRLKVGNRLLRVKYVM